jgi:hypothetical protein
LFVVAAFQIPERFSLALEERPLSSQLARDSMRSAFQRKRDRTFLSVCRFGSKEHFLNIQLITIVERLKR